MTLIEELRQTAGDAGNGLDRESRTAIDEAADGIDVLNGIRDALEARGFFHMANGRDIGNLLDGAPRRQDREAIANIIDPGVLKLPKINLYKTRWEEAFAKADAVLALRLPVCATK